MSLPAATRAAFRATSRVDLSWRLLRSAHLLASTLHLAGSSTRTPLAATPSVSVADCRTSLSLPGTLISNPEEASDPTVRRCFTETTGVAKFYKSCFGRNSVDDLGMTLASSVHYGSKYNNAFWNGSQMTFGDGDGRIFVDFTQSNDVVGHELTHAVTQYTAGLDYSGEAGGLNESISDAFGSMFRQWEAGQTAAEADWLIGAGILGPAAKARGYACLRDLSKPGAAHCLSPQPSHYADFVRDGDPHVNSGIPNHAFYLIATLIGGKSWETAGQIWYAALTDRKATPTMKLKTYSNLTKAAAKRLFPNGPAVHEAVVAGWKAVGL